MSAYDELSAEQKRVLRDIVEYGRTHKDSPKEILAAVETAIVEQSLHNLPYGDGTSVGWRQETAGSYGAAISPRLDLARTVPAFYNEARGVNSSNLSAGALAQAVQRSAYPGRYDEHKGLAEQLIAAVTGGAGVFTLGPTSTPTSAGGAPPASSPSQKSLTSEGLLGIGIKAMLYLALLAGGALLVWYGTHTALRPARGGQK